MIQMWSDEEYRSNQTLSLKNSHKDLYNNNPELRNVLSEKISYSWKVSKKEILDKQFETKSKNGSWNTSKPEEEYYSHLLETYSSDDIIRQYRDDRYPFYCDFYIKSQDLFIELQKTWCHGGHFFDQENPDDKKKLDQWIEKSKTSDYYKNAIKVWTETDLLKKKVSEQNNLNIQFIY